MIPAWNELADVWAEAILRASWQGGIAIALAWVVQRAWTSLSPRVVCWVWRVACFKLLVSLVWSQSVPLALLPAQIRGEPLPVPRFERMEPFESQPIANMPDVERPPAPLAPRPWPISVGMILLPLWSIGVGYCAIRGGRQWRVARRLVNAAQHAGDSRLSQLCAEEAGRLGLRRVPALGRSSQVDSPILVSVWRPTIIVPDRTEATFDEPELRMMLAHELAHLARHDLAWNWLPTVAGWLFFFHPLVWLMMRRWSEAQEAACDELVIQQRVAQPAAYGRLLLKLSSMAASEPQPGFTTAGVLGAYRNLERRVLAISRVKPFSGRRIAIAATLLLVIGTIAIVPWQLVAQEAPLANGAGIPDLQAIQGTWETVASLEEGKTYKVPPTMMTVFADDKVTTFFEGRKQHTGTVKLNTSVNPPSIEMKLKGETAGNLDQDTLGIYKLEDDKLIICVGVGSAEKKLPKTFAYSKAFRTSSVVLQREKPVDATRVKAERALNRLIELGAAPADLKNIGIQHGWKGTDADLKLINELPHLEWLHIDFQEKVGVAGLNQLKFERPVQYMNLGALSDDILAKTDQLPPCTILAVGIHELSETGFARLAELAAGIERLEIMGGALHQDNGVTDQGLRSVARIGSLKSLQLYDVGISDDGLAALSALDKLQSLELNQCWRIRGPGYANLAGVKSLRSLTAYAMKIDNAAVDSLAKLTRLTALNLQPVEKLTDESAERLRSALPGAEVKILAYENRMADFVVADDGQGNTEQFKVNKEAAENSRQLRAEVLIKSAQKWIARSEFSRAKADYEEALRDCPSGDPKKMVSCNLAWLLSTCPDDKIRDGKRAVELARTACEGYGWKGPNAAEAIDTLAAASAEVGSFEAAIKWQTMAMKLAAENQQFQSGAKERLTLYEQHQPYRDQSKPAAPPDNRSELKGGKLTFTPDRAGPTSSAPTKVTDKAGAQPDVSSDDSSSGHTVQYTETRTNQLPDGRKVQGLIRRVKVFGRYQHREEMLHTPGDQPERGDSSSYVQITDAGKGSLLTLNPVDKTYEHIEQIRSLDADGVLSESKPEPEPQADYYGRMRGVPIETATKLPDRYIDGKLTNGYEVISKAERKAGIDTLTHRYWIDPQTKLPTRVEATLRSTDPHRAESDWIRSEIVFDQPLDAELFSTEPPAGYKAGLKR